MKHLTLALMGVLVLSAPAFAKDYDNDVAEEREELRESQRSVDKDNADIRKYEKTMEQNRAEKARAKAEGDVGRQAYESMAIGANKAAIKKNEAERYVGRKMVEEDREDLQEARRDRSGREMSPSAGSRAYRGYHGYNDYRRDTTFWGMPADHMYSADARASHAANLTYWQGNANYNTDPYRANR